jgi:hypothetical protein
MGLKVTLVDNGLYAATVTPPNVEHAWSTKEPLPLRQLIEELQNRGCHQQDIGDVLYELDQDWLSKL